MRLQPGSRLGPYEIIAAIGAGGMGEVYQATDTNLRRKVAIKVLPDSLSGDAERLARFQREAEVLAALNHPCIAQIYGVERAAGTIGLVMELVDGPTLADRIATGAIPIPDALAIARQIAEALEAAHDLGIVHRDLKPANIKVRPDGQVKVLDFGLAKAGAASVGSSDLPGIALMNSPTITSPAMMTAAGMILGTAAYMAPEQAKGRPANRRADVWAFGCVLFEMLTGRQTFPGEDVTDVLAAVVRGEPDWNLLPASTPPAIETLIRRCLRKDPRQRLSDAAAARLEIDDVLAGHGTARPSPPAKTGLSKGAMAAGGVALLLAGALLAWTLKPGQAAPAARHTEVQVTLPATDVFDDSANNLAVAPDGRTIVYVAERDGVSRLYVRPLASFAATALPGTEGAYNPFFSPDSRWIGFFAQDKLKKISVDGGAAVPIASGAGVSGGASWGDDGTIVYAPSATTAGFGLWRVSADGGTPAKLTTPDTGKGEYSHRYPQILPGGKAVLFSALSGFGWDESRVEALTLATGERRVLVRGGHTGRYMRGGHLLYVRAGSLLDVPFDPDRLEVGSARPMPVADDVSLNQGPFGGLYDVSSANVLAWVPAPGGSRQLERRLAWIDRQGRSEPIAAPARNYDPPALSPDGRQIAVPIVAGTYELWIYDLARASLRQLGTGDSSSLTPVWSPDNRTLAYRNNKSGNWRVYAQPADGSGPELTLTTGSTNDTPVGWSPDGRTLMFARLTAAAGYDLWTVSLDGDRQARPFLPTSSSEPSAQFSPDGRWVAYASNASKVSQVYVTSYPDHAQRWQISTDGGNWPQWNPKGGELFYLSGGKMMVVDVTAGTSFSAGRPRVLYTGEPGVVSPDGQRFLTVAGAPVRQAREIKLMIDRF